jgi:hypothetical protein
MMAMSLKPTHEHELSRPIKHALVKINVHVVSKSDKPIVGTRIRADPTGVMVVWAMLIGRNLIATPPSF